MNELMKARIRKMVMQELASMVDEDALISRGSARDEYRRTPHNLSLVKHSDSYDDFGGAKDACNQCGSNNVYEGDCMECGYSSGRMLQEGGCGCSGESKDDSSDYSLDSMTSPTYGIGATSMHVDFPDHGEVNKHKHNNYMAKPSLYKVAKYAQKLLHMIPDGYELDDWQRTKIAQISDDISEVYHSLDYDFHDDED
jgi:hypothetical protein|tara:strand:- start:693 stop:1283 length:591 start_codon:yes stop_codon:yes gene_type:complete